MLRKLALILALAGAAAPAAAYIGPGAGISFVGSLFTWIIGILLALFAILFWPIRALIRRARGGKPKQAAEGENAAAPEPPADRTE